MLTTKEFDLLAFLAARPDRAFGRDELLRSVWHSSPDWQTVATVTEHVRRLRTKVEVDPKKPRLILTVRGIGYTLASGRSDPVEDPQAASSSAASGNLIEVAGLIVAADQSAITMVGLETEQDLVGRQLDEVIAPASHDAIQERKRKIAAGGSRRSRVPALRFADRTDVLVETVRITWQGRPARWKMLTAIADRSRRQVETEVFDELSATVVIVDVDEASSGSPRLAPPSERRGSAGPVVAHNGFVRVARPTGAITRGLDENDPVARVLRGLLRIQSAPAAAVLLQEAAVALGATLVSVDDARPDALPVDLSLGEGPPLLAEADPLSVARMQLERFLPRLAEDARQAVNLLRRSERLETESNRDRLTGLANRRVLDRALPRAHGGVVIMIDLDHFKQVNDTAGHQAGDEVLAGFGLLLGSGVRAGDVCCRIGGEEFVIVAPEIDVEAALRLIAHLRESWSTSAPRPVTFSAGVAAVHPSGGSVALVAADRALYRAKALGRNRTEVHTVQPATLDDA